MRKKRKSVIIFFSCYTEIKIQELIHKKTQLVWNNAVNKAFSKKLLHRKSGYCSNI
jgi:hypothetical protein